MRRILVFVVVAALALVMAVPAFALSEKGNCIGRDASGLNHVGKLMEQPGLGGAVTALVAKENRGVNQSCS